MADKKRIFIAEDHTILREGLKVLLSGNPDFELSERLRTVWRLFPE
jgi:DNA-binding NarL/FixJ family response regulator